MHDVVFASTLIWYHTQRQNTQDTQGPIGGYTDINIMHINTTCAQNKYPYCTNLLKQTCTLQSSTMSYLFKNHSLVKVVNLLIRFNKTKSFLRNTNNTNRNGICVKYIHHTLRERGRRFWTRHFGKISNIQPSLYKGEGVSNLERLLKQKYTLQRSTMPFLFKNYSLVEVINLLKWYKCVKYTQHIKHWEKDNFRKG